ncbi:hypothetical protein G6F40_015874 [Rhizopus arrhizus]|nr:hypothetical protein G6F40_015874 [Rhizopus arrhizus]
MRAPHICAAHQIPILQQVVEQVERTELPSWVALHGVEEIVVVQRHARDRIAVVVLEQVFRGDVVQQHHLVRVMELRP